MLVCNHNQAPITAILVLAGDPPDREEAERLRSLLGTCPRPLLLAADGGADHLAQLGLAPDLLLGDGDSLQGRYPMVERLCYAQEKDFSDGEAALDYALTHTEGRVLVFGALGGRLDHLLTNVMLPLELAGGVERVLLSGPGMEAGYSRGYAQIQGTPGDTVSLVVLGGPVQGITLSGLYYPLRDYDAVPGGSLTLSNVLTQPTSVVQHQNGVLLVIRYWRFPGV